MSEHENISADADQNPIEDQQGDASEVPAKAKQEQATDPSNPTDQPKAPPQDAGQGWFIRNLEKIDVIGTLICTVLIMIFTGVLTCVSLDQQRKTSESLLLTREALRETRESNTIAERANEAAELSAKVAQDQVALMQKQFEADQRPRLVINAASLGEIKTRDGRYREGRLEAINSGRGTAYRVTPHLTYRPAPATARMPFAGTIKLIMGYTTSKQTVAAAEPFHVSLVAVPDEAWGSIEYPFNPESGPSIAGPSFVTYIFGWIEYCDSLDRARRDPVCHWFATSDLGSPPEEVRSRPCVFPTKFIPRPDDSVCK